MMCLITTACVMSNGDPASGGWLGLAWVPEVAFRVENASPDNFVGWSDISAS